MFKMFKLHLQYEEIPRDSNEFHAMIQITPKRVKYDDIPPKNILYLLDVSGSVDIEMVKYSIIQSLPFLREEDEVSVISFSTETSVDVPWTKCTYENKFKIANDILNISSGGWSNISNGIFHAIEQCMEREAHIIVLSDGSPNSGITNVDRLISMVKNTIHGTNTRIHAFGYGKHETEFLRELTDACQGTYNYICSREELPVAYGSVLGAAMSLCLQGVSIQVESETLMFTDRDNKPVTSKYVGDVYGEERKQVVLKCHTIQEADTFDINYTIKGYNIITGENVTFSGTETIKRGDSNKENETVKKRMEELRVVEKLKEARSASTLERTMDILRHTNTPLENLQKDIDLLISAHDTEHSVKSLLNRVEQEYSNQRDNRSDDYVSEYYTSFRMWTSREVAHD